MEKFDIFVIGGGPGGYVAAIRASQLGLKVGLVEKESLGGVCLNWGCIPTKALIKSAQVLELITKSKALGISVEKVGVDIDKIVQRSRAIAKKLASGVSYLLKKNNVKVYSGLGSLLDANTIQIEESNQKVTVYSTNIIIATGARSRVVKGIEPDGKNIWTYREALVPDEVPKKILIIGAGVVGIEFAYFYNAIGSEVTVLDLEDRILPSLDKEITDIAFKELTKKGIDFKLRSKVIDVVKLDNTNEVKILSKDTENKVKVDKILSAVGISANIEGLNLSKIGIHVENGVIKVDRFCATDVKNIYAIGDVVKGPWLAHKASHEGVMVAEKIANKNPKPIEDSRIPSCIYANPQIANIGITEIEAKAKFGEINVGKFPFSANGRALTEEENVGLIKTIFVKSTGELVGAHMVGAEVTELIHGFALGMTLETTEEELVNTIYPHPTLSEISLESVLSAFNREIHL